MPPSQRCIDDDTRVSGDIVKKPVQQPVPSLDVSRVLQLPAEFIFALLRAIEVVIQFDSSSRPPREMGTRWSTVALSSQYAGCVTSVFQFGWYGNSAGSNAERIRNTGGKISFCPYTDL
jgi:hypothetical protein